MLGLGLVVSALAVSTASPPAADPVAAPGAVVSVGLARFTILSPQLIRLEHAMVPDVNVDNTGVTRNWGTPTPGDDRATSVVINRLVEPVPAFTVAKVNATAITITTSKLRLTYNAAVAFPSDSVVKDRTLSVCCPPPPPLLPTSTASTLRYPPPSSTSAPLKARVSQLRPPVSPPPPPLCGVMIEVRTIDSTLVVHRGGFGLGEFFLV